MKISKEQLIEMGACAEGLERFVQQTNNTDDAVDVSSLVGGSIAYCDAFWFAAKAISIERVIKCACDIALLNVERIKPYCSVTALRADKVAIAISSISSADEYAVKKLILEMFDEVK